MSKKYTVTCYYNTGFNTSNIPEGPEVLYTATTRSFDSIYHWQNKELQYVDIKTDYENIVDADYMKIGDAYYFITGIQMMSETRCARCFLQMDALTTLGGINNIEFTDGWVERAHASSDELFENIIPEPWSPSKELVLDEGKSFGNDVNYLTVLTSTVDLNELGNTAYSFLGLEGSNEIVSIPVPNKITQETDFAMFVSTTETAPGPVVKTKIPLTAAYVVNSGTDTDNFKDKLLDSINKLQGIGAIQDSISYCYNVPRSLIDGVLSDGFVESLGGVINNTSSNMINLPFQYADVKNKKVFSQYNTYELKSLASGNSMMYDAHDINAPGYKSPVWEWFSDVSPQGSVYARPFYFKGNYKDIFMNCVRGAGWLNNPIAASGMTGRTFEEYGFVANATKQIVPAAGKVLGSVGSMVMGNLTAPKATYTPPNWNVEEGGKLNINPGQGTEFENNGGRGLLDSSGFLGSFGNFMGTAFDLAGQAKQLTAKHDAVAPSIYFPRSVSIQNYIGNGFYVYRTRLDDSDVLKFDKFLTMFGYAQSKPLEKSDFTNRRYFNFVQLSSVNIKSNQAKRIREAAEEQLVGGVRIWHVLPDKIYYDNNPIRS